MNTNKSFSFIFHFSISCIVIASHFFQTSDGIETNKTVLKNAKSGKLYVLDSHLVNWPGALSICSSYNLELAIIENEEENLEVYGFLSGLDSYSDVWTAGNDLYENGNYFWGLEDKFVITFYDWISGNVPMDPFRGCISIVQAPTNSCENGKCTGWKESACTEKKKTLCMLA